MDPEKNEIWSLRIIINCYKIKDSTIIQGQPWPCWQMWLAGSHRNERVNESCFWMVLDNICTGHSYTCIQAKLYPPNGQGELVSSVGLFFLRNSNRKRDKIWSRKRNRKRTRNCNMNRKRTRNRNNIRSLNLSWSGTKQKQEQDQKNGV